MYCSDKVLNPYRVGLDLDTQEDLGEFSSCPIISLSGARSRPEPSSLDFSKSMTQLLGYLGNLNENPMGSRHTSHKDRLLKLEHNLSAMNTAIQNVQSLNLGVQAEQRKIEAMVAQHKSMR